jgi:hypothetical protein
VGVVVIVGVTVGVGGKSQLKNAEKSKLSQFVGAGVGLGHGPLVNRFAEISGQIELQGYEPSNRQVPPKVELKHHLSPE